MIVDITAFRFVGPLQNKKCFFGVFYICMNICSNESENIFIIYHKYFLNEPTLSVIMPPNNVAAGNNISMGLTEKGRER